MRSIQFKGAAGEVTGSGYILTTQHGDKILIDLGMFQGSPEHEHLNFEPLDFDASELTAVLLTHAHIDHCGRLPLLIKAGFKGMIYATKPTKDITHISLQDSAKIAAIEHKDLDIYTKDDVEQIYNRTSVVRYDEPFTISNLTITYRNAGHILGSASIEVTNGERIVCFSGDLGNTPQEIIEPTVYVKRADVVLIESTYGDSSHPVEDSAAIIQNEINEVEKTNGVLLIPAFSVERTQEILHIIGHLKEEGKVRAETPVYMDSPMAIKVTEIFKRYPNMYNEELSDDVHPFEFEGLHITKRANESKAIHETSVAKVIIAGSGMMSGGRIMHHLHKYLSNPSTRLLIVGYQAEGTPGRHIEDGDAFVEIKGDNIPIRATVTRMHAMSSHADQPRLLTWLKQIEGVKKVFITHGEELPREVLKQKIQSELGVKDVVLPMFNDEFEI